MSEDQYQSFVREQTKRLGSLDFDPETIIWHYTDGSGLLGILKSGTIYSTQVSCLNDSTEIRYASLLFEKALTEALSKYTGDERVKHFVARYLNLIQATTTTQQASHAPSPFFVSCFSRQEDSLGQWRAYSEGEDRYAIAFKAHKLFNRSNILVKVNYDRKLHEAIAVDVASATIRFYEEGITGKNAEELAKWDDAFLDGWDTKITYLAPLVKDPGFAEEEEFRIIHEFMPADLPGIQILQKRTMMTRHVPLSFPLGGEAWVPRLPIEKVMVGPCRHPSITGISVDTLLRQMGYGSGKIVHSTRPLQET